MILVAGLLETIFFVLMVEPSKDAFKNQNGKTVPLVWGHTHSDPNRVLGHAVLENRDEGVYAIVVSMTVNLDLLQRN